MLTQENQNPPNPESNHQETPETNLQKQPKNHSQNLSNSQQKAIAQVKGPCIILAGAGTGKTHTIVEKIKHLIETNTYKSNKIVCITFSNEAANNLLTRVRSQLSIEPEKEPIIRTFHALSSMILKKHGEKIGISKDFQILEPDEAKILLHTNLKVEIPLCHRYISALSTAKDLGITKEQIKEYIKIKNPLEENLKEKLESLQLELHTTYSSLSRERKAELKQKVKLTKSLHDLEKFITIWTSYEKLKDIKNLQDYSDLNNNSLELLKKFPDITEEIQYLIVDEFQDTNKIQLEMIFHLAKNKNITVVGDLNQSIYQFRGAYEENINQFRIHFGITNKEIFNLDKSFRSPNKNLALAHQ
ncbi:MAG: ATP-dependent helicase [Nanoarchaeota archaeon]|nr:ATP-dependent helicase [Nanoarchaeota archaeon]